MNSSSPPSRLRHPADSTAGTFASSCILVVLCGALAILMGVAVFRSVAPHPSDNISQVAMHVPSLDPDQVAAGEALFLSTCAACHGADALGVRGQGKNLVYSPFALLATDRELLQFITTGRSRYDARNTTNVSMPPKGGADWLGDEHLRQIVAYLRSLQDPWRVDAEGVELSRQALREAEQRAAAARAVAAAARKAARQEAAASPDTPPAEDEEVDAETLAFGRDNFISTCSSCHGKDALGLKNNGKDLIHSTFTRELSDDDLVAFVKRGRLPSDPLNTSKIAMPPKGGNPALSDERLEAIIAFLRSLQKAAPSQQ